MPRTLRLFFLVSLVVYAVLIVVLAHRNGAEGFDGYSFLGQAWRLTDGNYQNHFYDPARPRAFVALLAGFDSIARVFLGRVPQLQEYHLFTAGLVLATIVAWVWALTPLFSASAAYLVGILMMAHYLHLVHATFVLADVMSSLLWAVFFAVAWRAELTDGNAKPWVLLGSLAALIATTKYGHFFFLFAFAGSLWLAYRMKKEPFPWRGMGIAFLAHFAVIESLYRFAGGWTIGFWSPVKQHFALSKEYLPSAQGTNTYLAGRRWLYFQDLFYALGPWLLALAAIALLLFINKERIKQCWQTAREPKYFAFFLPWLFFMAFHQWISVKETRYFLPFLPGVFLLIALLCLQLTRKVGTVPVALLFLASLITPVLRISQSIHDSNELASHPGHREIPSLFAFFAQPVPHHKNCRLVYVCDRMVRGLRLDRNVYGVHMPGAQIERKYCDQKSSSIASLREKLMGKNIDEISEEVCFVGGASDFNLDPRPPVTAYRPLAIQISEADRAMWEAFPTASDESVRCERMPSQRYDCYLTRRFFTAS